MHASPTWPTGPRTCSTWCGAARDRPRMTSCSCCFGRGTGSLGEIHDVTPPEVAFEAEDFDGRFSFRIGGAAAPGDIERVVRSAGDVEHVTVGGEERRPAPEAPGPSGAGTPDARTRHIRVDLGRLDGLMDLIGELVTVRGRLQ